MKRAPELDRRVMPETGMTTIGICAVGTIGSNVVAKSAPDEYTLLLQASTFVAAPLLMNNVPYDIDKDSTPITNLGAVQLLVSCNSPDSGDQSESKKGGLGERRLCSNRTTASIGTRRSVTRRENVVSSAGLGRSRRVRAGQESND